MTNEDDLRRAREEGEREGKRHENVESRLTQLESRVRLIMVVAGGALLAVSKQIWDAVTSAVFK